MPWGWSFWKTGYAAAMVTDTAFYRYVRFLALNEVRVGLGRPGWTLDLGLGKWSWGVLASMLLYMVIRNLI